MPVEIRALALGLRPRITRRILARKKRLKNMSDTIWKDVLYICFFYQCFIQQVLLLVFLRYSHFLSFTLKTFEDSELISQCSPFQLHIIKMEHVNFHVDLLTKQ